jgi:hypothetical protein
MLKKNAVRLFCLVAVVMACFTACGIPSAAGKSKTITVRGAYVSGDIGKYLEIEDGKYTLEVSKDDTLSFNLTVRLRLKEEYHGDPETAANEFALIPLSKGETPVEGLVLRVSSNSRERFIDLLEGSVGDSVNVSFRGEPEQVATITKNEIMLHSLGGETARREAVKKKSSSVIFEAAAGIEAGTKAVASKYVLAVAPIEYKDRDFADQVRARVQQRLLEHTSINRFTLVDTTQIDRIATQHKFELSDWSSPNKVAEIGKALNANGLVIVTVGNRASDFGGDRTPVTVTILDINTMETLGALQTQFGNMGSNLRNLNINFK